eukprot:10248865-Heterocapsa_arctica.AAC.1
MGRMQSGWAWPMTTRCIALMRGTYGGAADLPPSTEALLPLLRRQTLLLSRDGARALLKQWSFPS